MGQAIAPSPAMTCSFTPDGWDGSDYEGWRHPPTDQKVGGSSPSERTTPDQGLPLEFHSSMRQLTCSAGERSARTGSNGETVTVRLGVSAQ